ncbi:MULTISPECIES: hypothetical protein [Methylobacteriaceae]|uniref:Uncharacterized protein n=1 Tax=Methylorubrum thiocyanatum TaxID=47958 RepID=A0AA40S5Q6_9HYPH|nr:hypothetical protein [Methylorubrum thiocyanatum]AWI88372.1 hypothetical protein C0214_09010 [Methylobacterium sp. DM1]MBA8914965.1 hypothetical protein [Methylorubrum thiocyanatum]GJE79372.1 hypothetical protein CJNNKLLH_0698 [Methylorubrum thiocyanatum]
MRQHPQIIPAVTIALDRDAELHSDKAPVERAVEVIECLAGRGFEIVPKPLPGSTAHDRVEFARRTGCWDGVSDKDYMAWARSLVPGAFVIRTVEELTTENKEAWSASVEGLYRGHPVRLEPGRLEPTETEKAARWAGRLIGEILDDGWDREEQAGIDAAAKDALARLKRDRGRMAFEDIDRNPPAAASHADYLISTWVRGLGEAVEWCEARLLPRRLVLTTRLRRVPSADQITDLGCRLDLVRELRGVVGVDRTGFDRQDLSVEIRFDFYISTIGVEYTPLDLPVRPAKAAA